MVFNRKEYMKEYIKQHYQNNKIKILDSYHKNKPKKQKGICPRCQKEFIKNKKTQLYCSKKCGDKAYYLNNQEKIKQNSLNWQEDNKEKQKIIHKKAMDKYSKTDKFKNSVLKNYYNNKDKWNCRKLTLKLIEIEIINPIKKCNHNINLQIHHEIYPITKEGIIKAVKEDKIYYLCVGCHKTLHNQEGERLKKTEKGL